MTTSDSTFITRVVLKNYKSIAACDVSLGPLTFLVGPNGSGKSNFVDALRFVSDALSTSLDHAIRARGGINEVLHRSGNRARDFGIRLEFRLGEHASGHYAFLIGAANGDACEVEDEECVIDGPIDGLEQLSPTLDPPAERRSLRVHDGLVVVDGQVVAPAPRDRLFLPIAPRPEFWHLDRLLKTMSFYSFQPDRMRIQVGSGADASLMPDGLNAAGILKRVTRDDPDISERIDAYLALLVPGLRGVSLRSEGEEEIIEFHQDAPEAKKVRRFPASSMSDGTLRALGILLALFQTQSNEHVLTPPLVGIEEPETGLHPAGVGVVFDALREASTWRQVLVTSHSSDLLDHKEVASDSILAVVADTGGTNIGPIEEIGQSVIHDRLFTVGDLLRIDQLRPATPNGDSDQKVRLFGDGAA